MLCICTSTRTRVLQSDALKWRRSHDASRQDGSLSMTMLRSGLYDGNR